ncbi:eukaryotic translation initiation factor 4 gamma 1-like [Anopheles cruzii]|uniref:eukaryotic translation initiation factor 4 gamma 1-like n=1 Tax=Anopheles cruzii TaxID=68878 RepID=UPI0022EC1A3A|nr:eukaryotic translation initiation factor 4 gamma 1-like [Anopheles cruzii]XP_052869688.1 eukaryotic translation initiation factor 4 gamma 1-like [Anopheles cruzii]
MATDSGDIATVTPGLVAAAETQQQQQQLLEDNNNKPLLTVGAADTAEPTPSVNGTTTEPPATEREVVENNLNNNLTAVKEVGDTEAIDETEEAAPTVGNNNSAGATTTPAGHASIGTRIRRTSEKLNEDTLGGLNARKKYSLDVLLSLKDSAIGREKPSTIPDVCRSLLKANPGTFVSTRHSMGGGGGGGVVGGGGGQDNSLLPAFMRGMGFGGPPPPSSSSSGGDGTDGGLRPPMNRNLYRGRLSAKEMSTRSSGGGPGAGGPAGGLDDLDGKMIRLNVNIGEEVKLKGSANAWKPRWMQKTEELDEEQQKTSELSRQFRSVLNKLTPENFGVLMEQVKKFEIDTEERLDNCIKILFEKAIMELNFSDTYAQMCKELGTLIEVQSSEKQTTNVLNFKRKLIAQCQREFEKHHLECKRTDTLAEENVKRAEESGVPPTAEEQAEMKLELEEQKYRIRRRALGTIRFIGELYKHEQLRAKVMITCMSMLLKDDMLDEESIECLCKLLTTIGARIEKEDERCLQDCFVKLQSVAERKTPMPGGELVCNRIRFMIMDLLDLRKDRWQPRRALATPKTREAIQREVEAEENKNWVLNYNLPRGGGGGGGGNHRHDYNQNDGGRSGGGGASKNKRFVDEDGFVQPVSTRNPWTMPAIDPKKINISVSKAAEETRLGSASMFQSWGKTNVFASLNTGDQAAAVPAPTPSFFGASGPMGGGGKGSGGSHKKSGGGGGGGGGGGNNSKKQHYHGRSSSHF